MHRFARPRHPVWDKLSLTTLDKAVYKSGQFLYDDFKYLILKEYLQNAQLIGSYHSASNAVFRSICVCG